MRRRGRLLLRLLFGLLVLLLGLLAAVRAYLPALIQRSTEAYLHQHVAPGIEVDDVDLALTQGVVTLRGFAWPAPEGAPEPHLFAFDSLSLDMGALARLRAGELVLRQAILTRPRLALAINSSELPRLNLAQQLPPASDTPEPPGELVPLDLGLLRITGGALVLHDQRFSPPAVLTLDQVSVEIEALRAPMPRGELGTRATLSAFVNGTSPLDLRIRGNFVNVHSGVDFDIAARLAELDLASLHGHFDEGSAIELLAGVADVDLVGTCRHNRLDASVTLRLRDLQVRERPGRSLGATVLGVSPAQAVAALNAGVAEAPVIIPLRGVLTDAAFDPLAQVEAGIRETLAARVQRAGPPGVEPRRFGQRPSPLKETREPPTPWPGDALGARSGPLSG